MRPALVVRRAADYLSRHDVESPLPTAELLLADALETDRAGLYTRVEGLSSAEAKRFGRALCRRCTGVPVQYLTHEQAFRRLSLEVRPGVFIPRPETEIVVEHALETIADVVAPLVVDVGSGTGAIALAIKDERPDARVIATDRSWEAVALTSANAARAGLRIHVVQGDLLDPMTPSNRGHLDLVVSNPPYLAAETRSSLAVEVLMEPPLALFGDVELYARLFTQARIALCPGGAAVVEIEETRTEEVMAAAASKGFERISVMCDLAGRDRVVVGWSAA